MNWKELYALVNEEIKEAVSGLYKPAGDVAFAELPALSQSVLGFTYTVTDAFTSDSRFTDYDTETQVGHNFPADTEVAVVVTGTAENPVYMFNVLGGIMDGYATKADLNDYVQKEQGKGLSSNDYTNADKQKLDGIINDNIIASDSTYSSSKIYSMFESLSNPVFGFIEHLDVLAPSQRIEATDANINYTNLTVDKTNGTYDLGGWYDFQWLKDNLPYMVHADGTVDYQLDPTDYEKKLDGTASDVSNQNYEGGAFSWAGRIYKYEKRDGNKRIVKFSMIPRPGFEPVGFKNPDGTIVAGRWIPMFYASVINGKATCIAGTQPSYSITTEQQKNALTAFDEDAFFFGGSFVETLIDLLYMFTGTTDIEGTLGYGNRSGYVNDSSVYYGVLANAVVGGGQFYGTTDGKSLNKIFHSIVLGSYQQWMRDPYELVVAGRVKVSKDYTYDLTGAQYEDTGIDVPDGTSSWKYALDYITIDEYGSVPDITKTGGSTSTGVCDGTYTRADQTSVTAVSLRFGYCSDGASDGVRARTWANTAGVAHWGIGFAALLSSPVAP